MVFQVRNIILLGGSTTEIRYSIVYEDSSSSLHISAKVGYNFSASPICRGPPFGDIAVFVARHLF